MIELKHYSAEHSGGTEFVSVCTLTHRFNLVGEWELREPGLNGGVFEHPDCDLCELDRGKQPFRAIALIEVSLIEVG